MKNRQSGATIVCRVGYTSSDDWPNWNTLAGTPPPNFLRPALTKAARHMKRFLRKEMKRFG